MSDHSLRLLVGTAKGTFIIDGDNDRRDWQVRGPYCAGWPINHVIADPATGTIWAGGGGEWTGAGVWRSEDDGHTWTLVKLTAGQFDAWASDDPAIAAQFGWDGETPPFADDFSQVWSLAGVADRLYAGTKPARLLVSDDSGRTWTPLTGLTEHPSAPGWNPGAAGLVLHSITADPDVPQALWIGISAAGVFYSADGGATWQRRNALADTGSALGGSHPAGPRDGDTGLCVHHLSHAAGQPGRLYQQNHCGTWRSDNGGGTWVDITAGLPSSFGFAVQTHPRDPQTIWTLPLNGDTEGRFPPGAAAAVWCSRDGGATWVAQRAGLPQQSCFFTVLRQGMGGDRRDPAGVYFGTTSGSVFASRDEGDTWQEIARHLPTVLSVEVLDRD